MRTPNQYLAPAFARLQGGPLRDCSETMRWGGRTGTVSRVGSPRRGEDSVLDSDIPEECRVLAPTVPFCGLARGDAVELGDTFRVVTSATDNITRSAFFTVGLSAAFEKCPAAYSGTRREAGHVRQIKHPLDVLLLESGTADNFADALAPTYATAYIVAVRRTDWPEVTEPEPSDVLEVAPGGHPFALKVSTVTRHDGWYILKCRTRG